MSNNSVPLPDLLLLEHFEGVYDYYIEGVYQVFKQDFIDRVTRFRGKQLSLKRHPIFQDRAYTFYHMTHTGDVEHERLPDIRRCERIPWARPTIENCDNWRLKVWPQVRTGKGGLRKRVCIWLELMDEPDYIIILDVRDRITLLWTAFVLEYPHEKRKKQKEYEAWLKTQKSLGET